MNFATLICLSVLVSLANTALADDAYINKFSVCDSTSVVVSNITIACDSPGAYYYGSSKYRNSATCEAGDKAKMKVDFLILADLQADAYLTLYVQGYGTVEPVMINTQDSLCSMLQSTNGTACPAAGSYSLSKTFYWGSQSDGYSYSFIPKVVVGVASTVNSNVFDLGGANTNKCAGSVNNDWTMGARKSMANSIKSFFATFGLLSASILAIVSAGWCILRQSRARSKVPKAIIVDEELDEMSYQAIRDNQNLVEV